MPVTLINYYLPRKLDAGTTLLKKSNAFYNSDRSEVSSEDFF